MWGPKEQLNFGFDVALKMVRAPNAEATSATQMPCDTDAESTSSMQPKIPMQMAEAEAASATPAEHRDECMKQADAVLEYLTEDKCKHGNLPHLCSSSVQL